MSDTTQTDVLTITQAGYLADLIRGVERCSKLRYYPFGSDSADNPAVVVLRAFTYPDGTMYPYAADIRDSHVWTSGMFERWFAVRDLLTAMDNAVNGTAGLDQPMAIVELS